MVVLQSMWKGPNHGWNFMESGPESATYVCLAFFVYAMMYPTMQALQRLAASRQLQSATFQVILATGW